MREKYPNFWLVAVYADYVARWERLKHSDSYPNEIIFQRDDRRDSGEGDKHGQNVQRCVYEADYVFKNTQTLEPARIIKQTLADKLMLDLPGMIGDRNWRAPWPPISS